MLCRDARVVNMATPKGFEGELKNFQKRDVGYLYFIGKSLNANQTGLGKTIEIIALNCLQKQYGGFMGHIQVVLAQSILQWHDEYKKFAPCLLVRVAEGKKIDRISIYQCDFDVLLISYHMLWQDWEWISSITYNSISYDECSFFKSPITKTSDIVNTLARRCRWVIPMSATPIQMCVTDLWSIFQVFNMNLLGSQAYFENRYLIRKREIVYFGGKRKTIMKVVGYQNMDELKQRIAPFYVRHRVGDSDIEEELPEVVNENKWVELLPEQRKTYNEVKKDILTHHYRGVELRSKYHTLKKIINGLKTLDPANPDISVKSDVVEELLTGDLAEEKTIIFCMYKASIRALVPRIAGHRIEYDYLWGDEPDKHVRRGIQNRFQSDPSLKVVLGTTALEMSLNLQAARFLVCFDLIYNPARVTQIVGRLRRIGSLHKTIVIVTIQVLKTIEEKLWGRLQQRQAVSDYVFDEKSDIFEQLTDDELYTLIRD